MYYALIMAGGSGTRLWPYSRRRRPKQMLTLIDERSMFNHAIERLRPVFQTEQIMVVTQARYVSSLNALSPELSPANFIIEPQGRGTASAIGLAGIHIRQQDPTAVMAVLTADHFIAQIDRFCTVLEVAEKVAQAGYLVTLGVEPASPSTSYGYIKRGEKVMTVDSFSVFRVEEFTEKPNPETAQAFVASGLYSWNSGMFIWRVDRILAEIERQLPGLYEALLQIEDKFGTTDYRAVVDRVWPQLSKQTIDYGVMEHAQNAVVIPIDVGWMDVGSWASLAELAASDEDRNTISAMHIGIDTHDTLIVSEAPRHLVATIGIEGLVIVTTNDITLVCPKDRAQEVRDLVMRLEQTQKDAWL